MKNKQTYKICIIAVLTLCQAAFLFFTFNTKLIFAQYDDILDSAPLNVSSSIFISSPRNNQTLENQVRLTAKTSDVNKVAFYWYITGGNDIKIGDAVRNPLFTGEWSLTINTNKYNNGQRKLIAQGYDNGGNVVVSNIVAVSLYNQIDSEIEYQNALVSTDESQTNFNTTNGQLDASDSELTTNNQDITEEDKEIANGPYTYIEITKPSNNEVITGSLNLTTSSYGSFDKLDFYIFTTDEATLLSPASWDGNSWTSADEIDTTEYSNGEKKIFVQGQDINGTGYRSDVVTIYIDNPDAVDDTEADTGTASSSDVGAAGDESADLRKDQPAEDDNLNSQQDNDSYIATDTAEQAENATPKTDEVDDECKYKNINDVEKCHAYLEQKALTKECLSQDIKTGEECNSFLSKKYVSGECADNNIAGENCTDFIFKKYEDSIICENLNEDGCASSIKQSHLTNIAATQEKFKKLEEKTDQIISQSITADELEKILGEETNLLPIKNGSAVFKILKSESKIVLDENNNLIQTSPVVLMLDSDRDGLPDNFEKRIGTDPNNADSDNDGYQDMEELKDNFNPSGPGKFSQKLSPVEEAIINEQALEQPKTEGDILDDLIVNNISNKKDIQPDDGEGYVISGQAQPNTVISIYVYSKLPLITTVKTDEYGNWQYHLNQPLVDGEHEVYIALNDNTGKIINKSRPFSLFIKEAKAVSIDDFIPSSAPQIKSAEDKLINFYLIISLIIISLGIIIFVILLAVHNKKRSS